MSLPPVLAFGELISALGVSRTRAAQLIARPDFPAPIATLGVGKIWAAADVLAWFERTGRTVQGESAAPTEP